MVELKGPHTVGVAQLVERWIVVPVVVGSNPTTHPTQIKVHLKSPRFTLSVPFGVAADLVLTVRRILGSDTPDVRDR